jgi:hypothetical protein
MITHERYTLEIKSRIAMAKAAFNKKKTLFNSKFDLNLREIQVNCYIWSIGFVVLKLRHFGKHIRNTWKVSKRGAAEGWRLVGPIMREDKKW